MLKAGGADVEGQILVLDGPALRQARQKLPLAATLFGAVVMGLRLAPQLRIRLGPNGLRVRPAQDHIAPALQLFAVAGIQHFVVYPSIS